MSDENLAKAPRTLWHIPTVAGAVTVCYNLEGNPQLKLDGPTLAGIFLGKITKWNDPAIASQNPGVKLPADEDIVVVHRSDGSGTSLHLHRLPEQREPGMEEQGFEGSIGQLADRPRREKQ